MPWNAQGKRKKPWKNRLAEPRRDASMQPWPANRRFFSPLVEYHIHRIGSAGFAAALRRRVPCNPGVYHV